MIRREISTLSMFEKSGNAPNHSKCCLITAVETQQNEKYSKHCLALFIIKSNKNINFN